MGVVCSASRKAVRLEEFVKITNGQSPKEVSMKYALIFITLLLFSCSKDEMSTGEISAPEVSSPGLANILPDRRGQDHFNIVFAHEYWTREQGPVIDRNGNIHADIVNAGKVNTNFGVVIEGKQVVSAQQPAIEDSDGSAADNARAINELLRAAREFGWIAQGEPPALAMKVKRQ